MVEIGKEFCVLFFRWASNVPYHDHPIPTAMQASANAHTHTQLLPLNMLRHASWALIDLMLMDFPLSAHRNRRDF